MEIDDSCFVQTAVQLVNVVSKLDAMMLDDVRSAAHAGRCIVAVLGHFIACASNYEASCRGDVEGVLAVASCTHNIDIAVCLKNGGHTRFEDAVAKAEQLFNRHASHLQAGQ